jgi:hypothetical protein
MNLAKLFSSAALITVACFCRSAAEETEILTNNFSVIGPSNVVYHVQLKNKFGAGLFVHLEPGSPRDTSFDIFARYLERPLLIDHSVQLGQLAIVPCYIVGGTGISYSRYLVLCFTGTGARLLQQGLAEYTESYTSGGFEKLLSLRSEFRGIKNGYAQIMTFTNAMTPINSAKTSSKFTTRQLELRFRAPPSPAPLVMKCELDRVGAAALAEILPSGATTIDQWAATVFSALSPKIGKACEDYLNAHAPERSSKKRHLLSVINSYFSAGK